MQVFGFMSCCINFGILEVLEVEKKEQLRALAAEKIFFPWIHLLAAVEKSMLIS